MLGRVSRSDSPGRRRGDVNFNFLWVSEWVGQSGRAGSVRCSGRVEGRSGGYEDVQINFAPPYSCITPPAARCISACCIPYCAPGRVTGVSNSTPLRHERAVEANKKPTWTWPASADRARASHALQTLLNTLWLRLAYSSCDAWHLAHNTSNLPVLAITSVIRVLKIIKCRPTLKVRHLHSWLLDWGNRGRVNTA